MSGIVTSAQIDVAFANYCTPYLNGNIIYEERGANNHVQNYWNEDGTEEISPSSFLQGQNVLAVYGRDYVAGWQNRQWLDLEINANIFEPSNETIIFGDTVTVAVKGGNKGDVSAEEVIIESFTNESTISSTIFSTTEPNFEDLIFFTWTPDYIGENILNLHISCNCSDGNSTNNNLTLNITTKIYRLKTEIENNLQYVNQTRNLVKIISITNNGGLTDNVTLIPSNGEINSQLTFSPNNFILNPGESKNVTVSTQLPLSIEDGFHNISFQVKTQHDYTVSEYLVNNGITNEVAWKWIESDGYEELYSNANWTTLGFNDTDWLNASTPFGDSSVDGVNYRTLWDEDNYA